MIIRRRRRSPEFHHLEKMSHFTKILHFQLCRRGKSNLDAFTWHEVYNREEIQNKVMKSIHNMQKCTTKCIKARKLHNDGVLR